MGALEILFIVIIIIIIIIIINIIIIIISFMAIVGQYDRRECRRLLHIFVLHVSKI